MNGGQKPTGQKPTSFRSAMTTPDKSPPKIDEGGRTKTHLRIDEGGQNLDGMLYVRDLWFSDSNNAHSKFRAN